MILDRAEVLRACHAIVDGTADPRYSHTSHVLVRIGGEVLMDEHLGGPASADVFSLTKSVLATVLGVMAARRLLPPVNQPLAYVLPELRGRPAASHTWRHVLTMTRGAETGGPWDVDEITALPGGQVAHSLKHRSDVRPANPLPTTTVAPTCCPPPPPTSSVNPSPTSRSENSSAPWASREPRGRATRTTRPSGTHTCDCDP